MPGGSAVPPLNPGPFKGSVIVKVDQGTKDGPKVSGEDATVEFFSQGRSVARSQGKLDASGNLMLNDIALPGPVQPLVTVEHAGIPFQIMAKPINADERDTVVRLTVFETTDQAPAWEVTMRHVMVMRAPEGGLQVSETIVVNNPADRVFMGAATNDKSLPRVSLTLQAPANALHIHPGKGFNPDAIKIEGNRILHGRPLMPRQSRFQLNYAIPADKDGTVTLELAAPAATARMMIFMPDDGAAVTATGLMADEPMANGQEQVRLYRAEQMPAGAKASLQIGKAKRSAAGAGESGDDLAQDLPDQPADKGSSTPQMVATYGVGTLVVGLVAVLLIKGKGAGHAAPNAKRA